MYAPEARGRWSSPPEDKGRRLGLQAPGGRPPVHIQDINSACDCLELIVSLGFIHSP